MIRTLLFSTLYPSSVRPSHGIFVETRLRHLLTSGQIETRVVAPVPWFPFAHPRFGEYAKHAAVPAHEVRNGIDVAHPRYLLLPKIGMNWAPASLARTGLAAARQLIAEGFDFDLIDAHYFYPDGVAATMIGQALGKPVVITARGTDINLIPQYEKPRRMILQAAKDCAAMITVCQALKDALVELGAPPEKITVLRNGVDLELFRPEDKAEARAAFGMGDRFAIASVGHLIERKGHHLVIEALAQIPDARLYIAGSGEEEIRLRAGCTAGCNGSCALFRCHAASQTSHALQRRRLPGARLQPRRLGQRAARSHGLRHAGRRQQRLGHARSRRRTRGRFADGRAQRRWHRARRRPPARCFADPQRHPRLRRAIRLAADERRAAGTVSAGSWSAIVGAGGTAPSAGQLPDVHR